MTTQTIYLPVNAENNTPEKEGKYFCLVSHGSIARKGGNKQVCTFERGRFYQVGDDWSFVESFLSETTAIILTPEQAEAYEKCVEIVQELAIADRIYEVTALTKQAQQALQQLNKVKP